jgi:hypothetical protein
MYVLDFTIVRDEADAEKLVTEMFIQRRAASVDSMRRPDRLRVGLSRWRVDARSIGRYLEREA